MGKVSLARPLDQNLLRSISTTIILRRSSKRDSKCPNNLKQRGRLLSSCTGDEEPPVVTIFPIRINFLVKGRPESKWPSFLSHQILQSDDYSCFSNLTNQCNHI